MPSIKPSTSNPRPAPAQPPAQTTKPTTSKPLATKAGINKAKGAFEGKVWADIGGQRKTLADGALDAWVLGNGRFVAWSGRDGGGGFENEGQSLRVYDTQTGKITKLFASDTMIEKVNSVVLKDGRTALLVAMRDGGLGGDHFSIVDAARGEVYRAPGLAARVGLAGEKVTVGFFDEKSYDSDERGAPKKTVTLDLKSVLDAPVRN